MAQTARVADSAEKRELVITRVEFVGGKFLYAVRVDTTLGFELCPSDVCDASDVFCPAGDATTATPRFHIVKKFEHPIIERYRRFIAVFLGVIILRTVVVPFIPF